MLLLSLRADINDSFLSPWKIILSNTGRDFPR